MRTAFVTLSNKRFQLGLEVLIYSMKKNAPEFWKNVDEKVLISPDIEEFSGFKICRVNDGDYCFNPAEKFKVNCYKMALFSLTDYDRIIFYEADTLCLGELAPLLTDYEFADFYSVTNYFFGLKDRRIVRGGLPAVIGDGWVVNKNMFEGWFHSNIIDMLEECKNGGYYKMAEQDAITMLLCDSGILTASLPEEYDFLRDIPELSNKTYRKYKDRIKMVHYVGKYKPFLFEGELITVPECLNPLDEIWYEFYSEYREQKNLGGRRSQ